MNFGLSEIIRPNWDSPELKLQHSGPEVMNSLATNTVTVRQLTLSFQQKEIFY